MKHFFTNYFVLTLILLVSINMSWAQQKSSAPAKRSHVKDIKIVKPIFNSQAAIAKQTRAVNNNALDFDGSDDVINMNGNMKLTGSAYSLEMWIKPNASNEQFIVYHGWGCITCPSWSLNIGPDLTCGVDVGTYNKITFQIGNEFVAQTGNVAVGSWTHVAVTYDGTDIKMYINGILDATLTTATTISDNGFCVLGGDPGCGWTRQPFNGKLDEIRVWDHALLVSQIQANINTNLIGDEVGLVEYYQFNQGTSGADNSVETVLLDKTANVHNGDLYNFTLNGSTSNFVTSTVPTIGFGDQVLTTAFSNLTHNMVDINAEITNIGSSNADERGVCYATHAGVSTADLKISETGNFGLGTYNIPLSGLTANTTYYAKSYSINFFGLSYGNEVSFTTLPNPNDLKFISLTAGDVPYTNTENVSVTFTNIGANPQTGFDLAYTYNGNTTTENYSGTINPGDTVSYIFTQIIDMYELKVYNISANVVLVGDDNNTDNSGSIQVNTEYVTIGSGTSTGFSIPIEPYYGYSYSQSIYLKSEVGGAGYINKVAFYYAPAPGFEGMSVSNQWKIYLSNTLKNDFINGDDWINISNFDTVFDATIASPTTAGWLYFNIAPFYYDGIGNLAVAVEENQFNYDEDEDEFAVTPVSTNRTIYHYDDNFNADPYSPPSASIQGAIPNFRFSYATSNDLSINDIVIGTKPPYTNAENVTIKIKNNGLNAQSGFNVSYTYNGNITTETYSGTINPNQEVNYTFANTVDFSAAASYSVLANSILLLDQNSTNDTIVRKFNSIVNANAIVFDLGSNNVSVADADSILTPSLLTFETWINSNSNNGSFAIYKSDWTDGWGLSADGNGSSQTNVRFFIGNSWGGSNVSYTIENNNWYHVAGTFDGTDMRLYVNGIEVGSIVSSMPINKISSNLFIGDDGSGYNNFEGALDEIRIWNKVLTAQEIKANMNLRNIPAQANLLLNLDFNQGIASGDNTSISTIWDKSGSNKDGLLAGFNLTNGNSTSNLINSEVVFIDQAPVNKNSCDYAANELSITATGTPSIAYQWLFSNDNGVSFSNLIESAEFVGTQNDTLTVDFTALNESYLYICKIIDGFYETTSDTVKIIKLAVPPTPIITFDGVLHSDAVSGNQWYKNGVLIPSATNQDYTPIADDTYYVVVTSVDNCASIASNTINVMTTGMENISTSNIEVYPNPTAGIVNINFANKNVELINVNDLAGRIIFETKNASEMKTINLSKYENGIYFIKIKTDKETSTIKIVKE